jgi:lipopolysaccharide transport system ATP-binding protein
MLNDNIVLSAKNISKKYSTHKSSLLKKEKEDTVFWALKDINFELKKGEILGIIGLNGAGKSTLLKILSEIIPPSSGEIEYEGSILSILDIGTGFHPDLSGHENIFLNASILGMQKKEVQKIVEDIIDFSGIRNSIHEPVKTYSNGMYLRLALSIALFTPNDILLIDEVVSVGDVEFREKGIRKIKEQAKTGKACIVISHDLGTILEFCSTCILLEKGEIIYHGSSKAVVEDYYNKYYSNKKPEYTLENNTDKCELISAICSKASFYMDEEVKITITYLVKEVGDYRLFLNIRNYQFKVMTASNAFAHSQKFNNIGIGKYEVVCTIPSNLFNNGSFLVDLIIGTEAEPYLAYEQVCRFEIKLKEWEINKSWNSLNEMIPFRPIANWEGKLME